MQMSMVILSMWMSCNDSGKEDSDEEANHDEQVG